MRSIGNKLAGALLLCLAAAGLARAGGFEFGGSLYTADLNAAAAAAPAAVSSPSLSDWQDFYPGEMWQRTNSAAQGDTILLAYGGYGADEPGARNWAKALAEAGGFRYAVAVKGPAAVDNSDHKKKKANELLVKMLSGGNFSKIVIAAHSSGTYVAHELLALLGLKENAALLAKTAYYNLDGATCVACKALAAAAPSFKYSCVGAAQGALRSPNYYSVEACGKDHFQALEFKAGCTGRWCLHGCLINANAAKIDPVRPSVPLYYNAPDLSAPSDFLNK